MYINGVASDSCFISTGVPLGSILGPLLFIIFVWDFPHFVKARELYLFICPRERFACHVVSISEPRRLGSSV